jgi:hypothetical protein
MEQSPPHLESRRVPAAAKESARLSATRLTLERRMRDLLGTEVAVTVTDNRRTMLSARRRGGVWRLRMHNMFLLAPPSVLAAVAEFVRERTSRASVEIDRYVASCEDLIRSRRTLGTVIRTQGRHHDLAAVLEHLNRELLGGRFQGQITWGRRGGKRRGPTKKTRSIRLGSYSARDRLIRIHPALDQRFVPYYVVAWVVYHEMLHQLVPAADQGGRRLVHTRRFRQLEELFPQYEQAKAWEQRNLPRLLVV